MNLNASFTLTKKWSISGSMDYDFKNRKINYSNMSISRNLHCWQMSFNFVPIGSYKSYAFQINLVSAMLKGMEFKRQSSYRDNANFNN